MLITRTETEPLHVNPPFALMTMSERPFEYELEEGEIIIEDEWGTYVINDNDVNDDGRPTIELAGLPYPIIIDNNGDVARTNHDDDAAVDLPARENVVVPAKGRALVPTGFHLGMFPSGYGAFVCSRSGLALKEGIIVANAPGVVDCGYEQEIGVILLNTTEEDFHVAIGDRVAQLAVWQVFRFRGKNGARGKKGLGSSGIA